MPHMTPFSIAPILLATASMAASPLAAAEVPVAVSPAPFAGTSVGEQIEQSQVAQHRRYDRHRHHRYRHRRGPGLGDVLTGVLIIGAISHVARAANRDDRRYRDRDRDDRRDVRWEDTRGIDRAVEMCVDAVETQDRVRDVERVDRTARGWQVEGQIASGDRFVCRIGPDGRIDALDLSGGDRSAYGEEDDDRRQDIEYKDEREDHDDDRRGDDQWDDDRYASEWSRIDRDARLAAIEPEPENGSAPIDGDLAEGEADTWPGDGV